MIEPETNAPCTRCRGETRMVRVCCQVCSRWVCVDCLDFDAGFGWLCRDCASGSVDADG